MLDITHSAKSIPPNTALSHRYQSIRQTTLDLCHPLEIEDYVVQPALDASPPKWHLGHVTWFFENFILEQEMLGYQVFDARLHWFFNSYYESQGPRINRSLRGNMTRPTLQQVLDYRNYVDEHMILWLKQKNGEGEGLGSELRHLVEIGLQHEQQHQELLVTDIKYILGNNPLYPKYAQIDEEEAAVMPAEMGWIDIAEGTYQIGYSGQSFSWDNERPRHHTYLHNCAVGDRLVTNGEYLEFIKAGAYEQFEHWLSEGWEWLKTLETKAPQYWFHSEGDWYCYDMSGLKRLNLNEPVTHISFYEADAYARWKGLRLPTEAEWEVACQKITQNIISDTANFLEGGSFRPRMAMPGHHQFFGDCWEWTNSAYLPYPNYPRFKGALGEYNGKFMVNQMVLRGGSCASPASHIRPSYRNFFHADKRWQFTGIRLAR